MSQRKHGQANNRRTGEWATTTYRAWTAMISRCYDRKGAAFKNYGGRGITVCSAWLTSFEAFYSDMGTRPKGLSLERKDNEKGYSPENCRWASWKEQAHNTRRTKNLTFQGETLCESEWAARLGINPSTLQGRIKRGWPLEKMLTTPALPNEGASQSHARFLTLGETTDTLTGWAKRLGTKPTTIWLRLKKGWPLERALTQKLRGS